MSNASTRPPAYVGHYADVDDALIANGCTILGHVKHSVVSIDAYVGERATVIDSVLFPGSRVEDGATVVNVVLGTNAVVKEGATLGDPKEETIAIGDDDVIEKEAE